MSSQFTFYIVDAFVDPEKPFSGNPAAVVILSKDSDICDDVKQSIAAQFNQCETVFVSKLENEDRFLIRWFTPLREIELCGHATMAASYILYTEPQYSGLIDRAKPVKYRTLYGLSLEASFDGQYVTLNFPSNDPTRIEPSQDKWITSLQRAILNDENAGFLDAQLHQNQYLLLRLRDDLDIEMVKPNFDRMLSVDTGRKVILVIVTQKASFERTGAHYTSRVFVPWVGVNEDPACGSACTLMAPYWARVFREQSNSKEFQGVQKNGGQKNDAQLNGVQQNGVQQNGVQQNGVQQNGAQQNGAQQNDAKQNGLFHMKQMSSRRGLITNKVANDRVIIGGQVRLFSIGQFTL